MMARGEMIRNPVGERTGPRFEAQWSNECEKGDTIDEGETIVMYNGGVYHVECAEESGLRVPR